jgi:prephenate dehydrogenase
MSNTYKFDRIAILSLGLMGASLAMSLKRNNLAQHISGYSRREATRSEALARGLVDDVFDSPKKAVKKASIIVVCSPVSVIPEIIKEIKDYIAPEAVLTDVGSSKSNIVKEVENMFIEETVPFVGSHPIAGSDQHGIAAAHSNLYRNASVIITPTTRTLKKAIETISSLWESLGAKVHITTPEIHDFALSRTSHLPHLVAALLVNTAAREGTSRFRVFCGPGFADTTRIAAGEPSLWLDIIKSNSKNIIEELKAFNIQANDFLEALEQQNWEKCLGVLESACKSRSDLLQK